MTTSLDSGVRQPLGTGYLFQVNLTTLRRIVVGEGIALRCSSSHGDVGSVGT